MRFDSRRAHVLGVIAVAGALVISGCGEKEEPSTEGPVVPITTTTPPAGGANGGGGQGGSSGGGAGQRKPVSDEKAVQETIEKYLTSPNAAMVCRTLITPELLRRTYGSVTGCEAARKPATLAVSVQISGLRVQGSRAEANAKPNGGVNNDERLSFQLIRSGENWMISVIRSNVRVGP